MDVLEQAVQRQSQDDEHGLVHQVGDHPDPDETSLGHYICRGRGRVAGNAHLGFHESFGETTEDGEQHNQDAGCPRDALG